MLLVLVEGLGGAPLRVQRLDQHDPRLVAESVLVDERLHQGDGVVRTARLEQRCPAPLDGDLVHLVEPERLRPGRLRVAEVAVRSASPESKCLGQGVRGLGRLLVPRSLHERLEDLGIELPRPEVQEVAGFAGEQHLAATGPGQAGAQLEDGTVQRRRRVLRRLFPEQVHQAVHGHDVACPRHQRGQQRRLPRSRERDVGAVAGRERHVAQDANEHGTSAAHCVEHSDDARVWFRPDAGIPATRSTAARSTRGTSGSRSRPSPSSSPSHGAASGRAGSPASPRRGSRGARSPRPR